MPFDKGLGCFRAESVVMVLHYEWGSTTDSLTDAEVRSAVRAVLTKVGERKKVLVVPPDFTRFNSKAGVITQYAYEYYGSALTDIMPALGTHDPVPDHHREKMFGDVPAELFRIHDWRNDVMTIGEVPANMVQDASGGQLDEPWPVQLNRLVVEGGHDLVLSIGQVVPHEVMGMANYNKNLLIGVGGKEAIHLSHFIGAVYGMERMMGVSDNPLRRILNYAADIFVHPRIPVVYILTVRGPGPEPRSMVTHGLFIGDDVSCFEKAAALSIQVNFTLLDEPLPKVVAFLDEEEFHSTWLGNKSIYRTRMAIQDGGELIVLAPGVRTFGEDKSIDQLIRKYGYRTTPEIMEALRRNQELRESLGAVAHLIHGSSEGRFRVTYCTQADGLSRQEVESVGYSYCPYEEMVKRYDPDKLQSGMNTLEDGERVYFIPAPAQGLWATRDRFSKELSVPVRHEHGGGGDGGGLEK